MFDWLGLSPTVIQIFGCVMIFLACVMLVFVIVIMVKSLKEIKKEKERASKTSEHKDNLEKIEPKNDTSKEVVVAKVETVAKEETETEAKQEKIVNFYIKKHKNLTAEQKENYTILKNTLSSFENLTNSLTLDGEIFKVKNIIVGALTIKNDTLKLFLKLSKKDLLQMFDSQSTEFKKYQKTPMEFALSGEGELAKAKNCFKNLAEELKLEKIENFETQTYDAFLKKFD